MGNCIRGRRVVLASLIPLLLAGSGGAAAQSTQPSAKPEPVIVDLVDPEAALGSYFAAQRAIDPAAINKTLQISVADKKDYVATAINFQLWSRYLERVAIAKFGQEDGLRVLGHVRSLDDQSALDLKRARDANIEYNKAQTTAKMFLRIERDRPENLQTDRFNFLDVYYLVKVGKEWKVDFLKTYDCLDPDKAETYIYEDAAFPRMTKVMRDLAGQIKGGQLKTADDVKAALDAQWSHVYDEPIKRTLKPGETMPATQPE